MSAIRTKEISLQLGKFHLDDISISFPEGKITTIVGPNGSGKSTLLKIISNLLKANDGSVYVYNKESKLYHTKDFAKVISMLPQSRGTLPNLTIKELISFGRSPYKPFFQQHLTKEDEEIIEEAMVMTNIKKYEDRLFYSLSGGEQQRARIALSLAQNTNILLLDEPTTYLDIAHQYEVMDLLTHINERYHLTIVMVLHDLQQAAYYSDYLIAMKHGKIVAKGESQNLLTSKFIKQVYEIDARIEFRDGYPLIIPNIRRKQDVYRYKLCKN